MGLRIGCGRVTDGTYSTVSNRRRWGDMKKWHGGKKKEEMMTIDVHEVKNHQKYIRLLIVLNMLCQKYYVMVVMNYVYLF